MRKLLKIFTVLAAGALVLVLVGSAGAVYLVHRYGAELPDYRQLAHYQPPTVTRVHAADGRLLAEFAHEKRIFVPVEAIPKRVVQAFLAANPKFNRALHRAPHAYAGVCADLVAEIAPYMTKTRSQRWADRAKKLFGATTTAAKSAPHMVVTFVKNAVEEAPTLAKRLGEDVKILAEERARAKAAKKAAEPMADAAE